MHKEGELQPATLQPLSIVDIENNIATVRIRGRLTVECIQTEVEISNAFKHLIEKVASPYGTFHLENSDVFFLHTFRPKNKPAVGWVSGEDFVQEDAFEEDCLVTNVQELEIEGPRRHDEEREVYHLWGAKKEKEEEDDGFGVGGGKEAPKKKKPLTRTQTMNFRLKMKMSGEACTSKTLNCSPVIHYEKRTTSWMMA